jgi:glycosyltransferase involved in cell wall biosynthesis
VSNKLLSIVVLNWNRLVYSKQTIECVVKKTTVPYVLTLVDNNSDPSSGVREYLSSITKANTNAVEVLHVFNSKNLGVAGGRNSGIYEVEQRGLAPDYLFNVDDDVLLPDSYDKMLVEVCDKVPKLGITGVNVEPNKYPVFELGGVRVQLKRVGNLGGAALCLPRRVFNSVGYYGFGLGTIYGHEDSIMRSKMDMLGLLSCYIESAGVHLDTDKDKAYRIAKNDAHKKGSVQLRELSKSVMQMRNTGVVYTPYVPSESYHPVDEAMFTNDLMTGGKGG